jgi:hypothetical protein
VVSHGLSLTTASTRITNRIAIETVSNATDQCLGLSWRATTVPFWAEALGYVAQQPPDGHETWRAWYLSVGVREDELGEDDCTDRLEDPEGNGPKIWFQVVPEGKVAKNRLHLDIKVSGGRGVPPCGAQAARRGEGGEAARGRRDHAAGWLPPRA